MKFVKTDQNSWFGCLVGLAVWWFDINSGILFIVT